MKEEKTEYYISLFDEYLDGTLGADKEQEIKTGLNEYPFLHDVLRHHVQARANIRVEGERILKEKFSKNFELIPSITPKKSNFLKYLISLLLVIGIAVAAYFFLIKEKEETLPMLAQIENPSYDLMRSPDQTAFDTLWESAINSFSIEEYQHCLNQLLKISSPDFLDKNLGKYELMKGVSYLKLEQYENARLSFVNIQSDNPYFDQSLWYEALSYYYQSKKKEAELAFNNILNLPDHYKKAEAKNYLAQIKNAE